MLCPRCNEGTIQKILFKKEQQMAYLCDSCDRLWLEGESIGPTTGHTLQGYAQGKDLEYDVLGLNEKDQEHQMVGDVKISKKS